jgi:tetratricopeptide (TPR) repeat protein
VTRGFVGAALIAGCLASAVAIVVIRDRHAGSTVQASDVLYFRSGEVLARVALSFDALLADVYWIRAVQHYGGTRLSKDPTKRYHLLQPLLDITTTLDPSFNIAYRFGAYFLAEPFPSGAGRPDQAIALLEKGFRASPDRWQYLQDIGMVHYWWRHDYQAAAEAFRKASEVPGAPWWLKPLVPAMLTEGGDRQSARLLWSELRKAADNDWLRRDAGRRLLQLDALDHLDQLRELSRGFASRFGRLPSSWSDLVRAGLLQGVPLDPTGEPYEIDPTTGWVSLSQRSPLFPLPAEPKPRPAGGDRGPDS